MSFVWMDWSWRFLEAGFCFNGLITASERCGATIYFWKGAELHNRQTGAPKIIESLEWVRSRKSLTFRCPDTIAAVPREEAASISPSEIEHSEDYPISSQLSIPGQSDLPPGQIDGTDSLTAPLLASSLYVNYVPGFLNSSTKLINAYLSCR
jgi:hypothetical protein